MARNIKQITKTDMARVIVTALYNLEELVSEGNPQVVKLVRRAKRSQLIRQHKLALAAIDLREIEDRDRKMEQHSKTNTQTTGKTI